MMTSHENNTFFTPATFLFSSSHAKALTHTNKKRGPKIRLQHKYGKSVDFMPWRHQRLWVKLITSFASLSIWNTAYNHCLRPNRLEMVNYNRYGLLFLYIAIWNQEMSIRPIRLTNLCKFLRCHKIGIKVFQLHLLDNFKVLAPIHSLIPLFFQQNEIWVSEDESYFRMLQWKTFSEIRKRGNHHFV